MENKDFYALLARTEPDGDYPYGSCQYTTVSQAYQAATKAGILNILGTFNEDHILRNLAQKGKKDELFQEAKELILWNSLKTRDQAHGKEQAIRVAQAVKASKVEGHILALELYEPEEDFKELQAVLDCKDFQELLTWMQESAWDLRSVLLPVCSPELDKLVLPDVGVGPKFNVMAWEDGYSTGIEMALMEYLMEEKFDWGRWDT